MGGFETGHSKADTALYSMPTKKLVRLKRQPMTITDTPGTVFEKIALDIVGPLPKTKDDNEYNNQVYVLITDVRDCYFCFAVPNYSSSNWIRL